VKILFVCTGNSCRSVMAEYLMKKFLEDEGIEGVDVASAGTAAWTGGTASYEVVELLREFGLDASAHRSRMIDKEIVEWADIILAMEKGHVAFIKEQFPSSEDKVRLLKKFAMDVKGEIDDPIGRGFPAYRRALREIYDCVENIAKMIKEGKLK